MPNLNAALACAQLENLDRFLADKRELAMLYRDFFSTQPTIDFIPEPENTRANYWLNAILLQDLKARDLFLAESNKAAVQTRPAWTLLNQLEIYGHCQTDALANAIWLAERIVNLPSSVRP